MGWVVDLDGVVWLADRPIVGASDAIERLRSAGEAVVFVTNNSSVTIADQEKKLRRHGIDGDGAVITSAAAAASEVEPGEVALVCAGEGVVEAMTARGVEVVADGKADVVVVGYHRDFDYERMTVAATAVRDGARLLATNDDATYPTPDGPIPGTGAILAGVVTASGARPTVAGKPHAPMVRCVQERLGVDGTVVGDRPDTDGRFATQLGYRFALVLSGVTRSEDLPVEPAPDLVGDDLAAVVAEATA